MKEKRISDPDPKTTKHQMWKPNQVSVSSPQMDSEKIDNNEDRLDSIKTENVELKKEILKLTHYNAQLKIGLSESESLVQELRNEISVQLLRQANKDWALKQLETRIDNLEKNNDIRNAIITDKIPDETNPMITSNNQQTVSYQQQEAKCYIELIDELQKELTISQNNAHSLKQNELKFLKEMRNVNAELNRQIHSKLSDENETIKKFAALVGELQNELFIMEAKAAASTVSENQLIEVIDHLKAELDHINGENNSQMELFDNLEQLISSLEEKISELQKENESLLKKTNKKFKNVFKKKEKTNNIQEETKPSSVSEKLFDKKEKFKRGVKEFRNRITFPL